MLKPDMRKTTADTISPVERLHALVAADMAATDKLRVLCYHIPFPGLGRVERKGTAYAWVREG